MSNRPKVLNGVRILEETGCGTLNIMIFENEIFAVMKKSGACMGAQTEAIGRLASLILKNAENKSDMFDIIIDQLRNIKCPTPHFAEGGAVSCADAVAKALLFYKNL